MSYVLGVGAALVDLLLEEKDEFVLQYASQKGGMNFVEATFAETAISKSSQESKKVPGGSACNTIVALAELGIEARFQGKIGKDEFGIFFQKGIEASGVKAELINSDVATGRVLSVVTPDSQRTMFTCLGAAAELSTTELHEDVVKGASLLYLEGYLAFNEEVFRELVLWAREAKVPVALDLASFDVVQIKKDLLLWAMEEPIAILLANEDEAKAFTGLEEEDALDPLSKYAELTIVKVGAKGAWALSDGERVFASGNPVQALDTTGAGDLWAAGFLSKHLKGVSLLESLSFGNVVGAEIVQVMGAHLSKDVWASL